MSILRIECEYELRQCHAFHINIVKCTLSYFKLIQINWERQQQQISYLSSLDVGCDWLRPLSGFIRNCQFLQSPVSGCSWDCPCLSLRRQRIRIRIRIRSQESPSPRSAHYLAHVTRGIMGITQPWLGDCTLLSKSIRVSSVSNHNAYDLWITRNYEQIENT